MLFINSLFLSLLTGLVACSTASQYTSLDPSAQPEGRVLTGLIFDVNQQDWVDPQELRTRLEQAQYILLGETHDNHHHHQIQSRLIADIAELYPDSSVSFEMIDDAQARALGDMNNYTVDILIERLASFSNAWAYQTQYRQLIATALERQLRIYPANIERKKLQAILLDDAMELDPSLTRWLNKIPLANEQEESLRNEIVNAHCGMIDYDAAIPMVKVQRLRDITMALSLTNSAAEKRILIAGAGHVRNDRGVPYYLRQISTGADIVALGLIETEAAEKNLDYYQQRWEDNRFPFDLVWFTERVEREDPCDAFRPSS